MLQNSHTHVNNTSLKNPFAGILYCNLCKKAIVRRFINNKYEYLMCNNPNCQNATTELNTIENCIMGIVEKYFNCTINSPIYEPENNSNELFCIDKELKKLNFQLNTLFDLLEQKIYGIETFLERKQILEEKINMLTLEKEKIKNTTINHINYNVSLVELYKILDIKGKNQLLKNIFSKIYYSKIDDKIEITIYSKLPIK